MINCNFLRFFFTYYLHVNATMLQMTCLTTFPVFVSGRHTFFVSLFPQLTLVFFQTPLSDFSRRV